MIINLQAKNIDLTPALETHINKKINPWARFLKKWDKEGAVTIDFEVARVTKHHHKGAVYYAEANIKIGGAMIRVEQMADNLYKAVDEVGDRAKLEIARFKEKQMKNQ